MGEQIKFDWCSPTRYRIKSFEFVRIYWKKQKDFLLLVRKFDYCETILWPASKTVPIHVYRTKFLTSRGFTGGENYLWRVKKLGYKTKLWTRTVLLVKRNILLGVENDRFEHGLLNKIFRHIQFYLRQEIILTGVDSLVIEQNTLFLTGVENWIIEPTVEFARYYWRKEIIFPGVESSVLE